MTEVEQRPQGVSRRAMMTAAVWAVPAIALTAITPAAGAAMQTDGLVLTPIFFRKGNIVVIELAVTRNGQPVKRLSVGVKITVGSDVTDSIRRVTDANGRVSYPLPTFKYAEREAQGGFVTFTVTGAEPLVVDLPARETL